MEADRRLAAALEAARIVDGLDAQVCQTAPTKKPIEAA
jgi:hypothetical protein